MCLFGLKSALELYAADFAATAAVIQPGEDRQQRGFPRSRLANQRNGLGAFDNQFNSGKDG